MRPLESDPSSTKLFSSKKKSTDNQNWLNTLGSDIVDLPYELFVHGTYVGGSEENHTPGNVYVWVVALSMLRDEPHQDQNPLGRFVWT